MLKHCVLLLALVASPAFAMTGQNSVGAEASVSAGGLAIGGDYEYALQKNLGVGGYLHYFGKNTPGKDGSDAANGMFFFGGLGNAHYVVGALDAYLGAGFGFVNIDPVNPVLSTTLSAGPRFQTGLLYNINQTCAVGFEYTNYWSWFSSDFNGILISDMAAKFRATF